jgi:hypothetical protein
MVIGRPLGQIHQDVPGMNITPHFNDRFPALAAIVSALLLLSACGGSDDSLLDQLNSSSSRSTTPLSSSSSSANDSSAGNSSAGNSSAAATSSAVAGNSSSPAAASSSANSSAVSSVSSSASNIIDSQAPTTPVLSQKGLLSTSASISWTAASDNRGVTAYRIFRNGTQIAQVGNGTLSFTDDTLSANTSYTYTVRAGDAGGNWSGVSNSLRLKTLIVSSDVTIEWFIPTERENGDYLELAEIGGYEIRYKLLSATQYTSVTVSDGGVDQYDLGYLAGDYEFEIATFDTNGLYSDFVAINPADL